MNICIFEDGRVSRLDPLTITRPAFDIRCGASSILDWQRCYFEAGATGALVRPVLVELCRLAHPEMTINSPAWLRAGVKVLVNARWFPPAPAVPELSSPCVALADDQVAYVVLPADGFSKMPLGSGAPLVVDEWLEKWRTTLPRTSVGGRMIDYPWDLIDVNGAALCRFEEMCDISRFTTSRNITVVGPADRLLVDPSAYVEPLVFADTTQGPVVIERGARVKAFSRLEGPVYIGPGTWVQGAKISGSTIGPVCRVGGEVEAAIMHGHANKAHEGFLGHSYVGEWVNLAAGTQASDLRNDYQNVVMTVDGKKLDTGRTKVGCFLGDHTKTGINTLLNTGTVAGVFCQIFPSHLLPPRVIPSFCTFSRGHLEEESNLDQQLATAALVMRRREMELAQVQVDFFRQLYRATAAERAKVLRESQGREARRQ